VPEDRGRGIYSALVAKRLTDARGVGRRAAVLQAVRSTSAPSGAKLGFREVCELEFYAWEGAPHQDIPMLQLED
jgi:predicted GNAT family acetyltransferase